MLKKCMKQLAVVCLSVGVFTCTASAMSKEDFLKFLVNTSYPEINNKADSLKSKDKKDIVNKNKKSNSNNQKSTEDFAKVYVGENNVPKEDENKNIKDNKDDKEQNSNEDLKDSKNVSSLDYKNDMRLTQSQPKILLYHTHGCETYSNSPKGNYHSKDKVNSVMEVGSALTTELANKGLGVLHITKYHDYPSFNSSYSNSLKTIRSILPKYQSIKFGIDLHRDAKDTSNKVLKDKAHADDTIVINGKRVAKFLFVVGGKNPNKVHLRKVADDLTKLGNKKYPGLVSKVVEKDYAKFNQFATKEHVLVEVGSNAVSVDEAKASTKYIAEILSDYFKSNDL